MSYLINIHPWLGTDHCLRLNDGDEDCQCCNDHTGCLYNDSSNGCGHPAKKPQVNQHDSPLLKKEQACLRCKKIGYNFRKLGPEHICPDCWWTAKIKYT